MTYIVYRIPTRTDRIVVVVAATRRRWGRGWKGWEIKKDCSPMKGSVWKKGSYWFIVVVVGEEEVKR